MAETHLNDISKVYLDQVAEADSLAAMQARREKRLAAQRKREGTTSTGRDFGRDDSLSADQQKKRRDAEFKAGIGTKKEEVEVDEAMSSYDRNRKRAAQRAAQRNAARAAGKTGVVPGVGYVSPRKERETYVDSAGTTRHKSGAKMESLDPVGQEDGDVNNDGKKDKTDKYLMKRRKAIAASINKKKVKESFSDWRTELSEVIGDTDVKKKSETPKIKEGNVDNASKIKINPEIKEAVEEIGGTLLEMVEVDEMDYILESVYDELIEEGFTEEDVEFGIEQALVQDLEEVTSPAKVAALKMKKATYTVKPETKEEPKKSFKDRLKSAAKNAIVGASRAVGSMVKKKADAQSGVGKTKKKIGHYVKRAKELARQGYEQGRGPVEKKPTTYRGAGAGRREMIGSVFTPKKSTRSEEVDPKEKQMLAKKKQMMLKQQLLDKQRLQMQQQGRIPAGHRTEATEDSLRDRRMERGGVDGNVRYDKPAKNIATAKSKSKMSSDDVFKKVKAELIAKHGKGSIIDTKKK